MKVEDLRIGDLVYCTYWPEKRIVRIYELKRNFNDELMAVVMDETPCTFPEKYIEPIPLTTEILEKNGFVYNNLPFVQAWEQYGLSIYGDGLINCGPNVSLKCQCVHQLQHILRDCGIDKEIKL